MPTFTNYTGLQPHLEVPNHLPGHFWWYCNNVLSDNSFLLYSLSVLSLFLQLSAFRCPQRRKLHAARSGDHVGHGMSPRYEIRCPGTIFLRTFMDCFEVCVVALSC